MRFSGESFRLPISHGMDGCVEGTNTGGLWWSTRCPRGAVAVQSKVPFPLYIPQMEIPNPRGGAMRRGTWDVARPISPDCSCVPAVRGAGDCCGMTSVPGEARRAVEGYEAAVRGRPAGTSRLAKRTNLSKSNECTPMNECPKMYNDTSGLLQMTPAAQTCY